MDKTTVTRTFSIGGNCSGAKVKEDLFASRRHSSAGIRALLWATSSAKSLGGSLGSDFQTSRESIFPNILTPDSIPQFTIPSLSVQSSLISLDQEEEDTELEDGLGDSGIELESSRYSSTSSKLSSSVSFQGASLILSDRKAERSVSDPLAQRRAHLQRKVSHSCSHIDAQHCLDPASRAALSLTHLTKVTTPYGFVTLSQSPQMVSEEALLCQAGLLRLNKEEETACCLSKAPRTQAVDNKGSSSNPPGDKKRFSKDSTESHHRDRVAGGEMKASSANTTNAAVSFSATQRQQDGKLKLSFYNVFKKHFASRHLE